jgi:hypothetical protein
MKKLGGVLSGGLALAAAVSLAACATTTPPSTATSSAAAAPVKARPYPEGIKCVWKPELRHGYYTVIDHRHLVVQSPAKKYYLLTLQRYCMDLESSINVGFQTHGSQLCAPGDSVITPKDRCPINYIEPVASVAEAKALVKGRADVKKQQQDEGIQPPH